MCISLSNQNVTLARSREVPRIHRHLITYNIVVLLYDSQATGYLFLIMGAEGGRSTFDTECSR